MKVTKREILASISIVAVMLLVGILISGKISDCQLDNNEKYNKAVKIESQELFQYGMKTNVGNAFVYGKLKAVDTVTYSEIGGNYMYVEKVKEKYTRHTEVYTTTDSKGHTHTHVRTYWTWDNVGSESVKCRELKFCDIKFSSKKIALPNPDYITTIKESSRIRYKYYGVKTQYRGTIFTQLQNNTISNNSKFYENYTIEETTKYLESGIDIILFWIAWLVFVTFIVFGFYYLDNRWLE